MASNMVVLRAIQLPELNKNMNNINHLCLMAAFTTTLLGADFLTKSGIDI
jgi:hypothetical protein